MNKKTVTKLFLLFLLFSIYPSLQCNLSKNGFIKPNETGIFRLIDHLKPIHVKSTPFADVLENFKIEEEDFSGKLSSFQELSTNTQKLWAVKTSSSILGHDEMEEPQGMEILLNEKKINFLNESDENSIRWRWIKTNREIDIKNDKNFQKGRNCLILGEGVSFSFDAILPNTSVEFAIQARRRGGPIDLEVYIDDEFIEKRRVSRSMKALKISKNATLGTHTIMLKPSTTKKAEKKAKKTPSRLRIYKVTIRTKNDIVLFFVPSAQQDEFLKSSIRARYFSAQAESGKESSHPDLYKMKHDFTLNKFDQNENPENIKKKIALNDLSMNVLMAPPKSQFEFKLSIPPESFLELGTGIFSYDKIEHPQRVKFKIIAEEGNAQKILLEKVFQLKQESQRDQLAFEKIDLASLAKKNVKLIFLTEKVEDSSENNVFSFWSNPIVYQPSPEKLKVILISLDTLRADHLGCYGYQRETSPNIDELVEDSVLFENVYAQSPWTLPSHLSMLFSLNSASHQVYYNNQKIDDSLPSITSFLRKHGFMTYGFTGGGYVSRIFGFSKGFDWYDEHFGKSLAVLGTDEAERLFAHTSDWLKENKDKPFFLFLHTFQIHGPYECPSPWNEAFLDEEKKWKKFNLVKFFRERGRDHTFTPQEIDNIMSLYDGEIRYTDEELIKPLITLLKELGIYDNTLLIITSDHGEEFYDHKGWLHSSTLYNELIHVPLVMKFPNSEFKGTKVKAKSRLIDIMPTVLETASVKYNKKHLDGKSLMDLIEGRELEDRTFISDLAYKNVYDTTPAMIATNENNLKIILSKSKESVKDIEIYDLQRDPKEKTNIIGKQRKLGQKLIDILNEYYREKQKVQRKKEQLQLDEKLKEKLRALGYLQ